STLFPTRRSSDLDQHVIMVDYRHAADLLLAHAPRDVLDILVLVAPPDLLGHDLINPGHIRRFANRGGAYSDVPVGDHTDQPLPVAHRQDTHIELVHLPRRLAQARIGRYDLDLSGHDLGNYHRKSLGFWPQTHSLSKRHLLVRVPENGHMQPTCRAGVD